MRISEKVVYVWFIFGLFLVFSSSGTNVESSGAPGIGTAVQEQMRISSKSGLFFVYFWFFFQLRHNFPRIQRRGGFAESAQEQPNP